VGNTPSAIERKMAQSATAFLQIVWPRVRRAFGDGDLIPVESVTDSNMARRLDMLAGIDAWHIQTGAGIRGIASRVQVGRSWRSFTIRLALDSGADTEYAKRGRAIRAAPGRWLFPYLTCQAYLANWDGPLLSAAVAKTSDIITCVDNGWCEKRRTDNASFAVVFWNVMTQHDFLVNTYEGEAS